MKIKKSLITILIFVTLITISNISKAGYLEFKNLEINAIIKENGDMQVTEYWKIDISDTNTLFKNWNLDNSKYSGIENVKVAEILENGTKKEFEQIDQEMYHVTKGCYYALPISKSKFEVAWGVQVDDDVRNYEITYTVKDAVKRYADYYEIYWQFMGDDNSISAKNMTGTIVLENPVEDKNNLRAWAHGPLTGNIEIVSNDTVKFDINKLNKNTMVEVRMAILEDSVFNNLPLISSSNTFDKVIKQETAWADEANRIREQNTKRIQAIALMYIGISIIITIFAIAKLNKALKAKKEVLSEKIEPTQKFDYFRDVPDETASPAEAIFISTFGKTSIQIGGTGEILSATILNLCLKNRIEFMVDNSKKKDNIIFVIKEDSTNNNKPLTSDEELVYDLLTQAANYIKDTEERTTGIKKLTVKELQKYANKNPEKFIKIIEQINEEAKNTAINKGKYDKNLVSSANKWMTFCVIYFVFGMCGLPLLILPGVLFFITSGVYYKIYKAMYTLTQKGEDEKAKWHGLKRYMEEFSLLKEKEVPHLVLWEKFLVYATAFGIADKVIKQLKIVYPEIEDIDSNNYTYMNLMYNTAFSLSFINSLDKSVTNIYSNAHSSYYNSNSSSGGGFGGGFSRRWWLRRRWSEAVEADKNFYKILWCSLDLI